MKSILAGLLFCHVLVGISSFSPFEDLTSVKRAELKQERERADALKSLLDDEEFVEEEFVEDDHSPDANSLSGPGLGGGDDEEAEKAIQSVVDALRDSVIPAVVKATKVKKEKEQEYTETIVREMTDGNKRDAKRAIGKSVVEAYGNCTQLMHTFFVSAYKEGVFHLLKEALDSGEIDVEQLIYKIINEVSKNDGGILGDLFEALGGDNRLHPAMKAVVVMNKVLLHAACGNPTAVLAKAAVGTSFNDPDSPFASLSDKIIPFLGKPGACRKGLINKDDRPVSLKQKFFSLIFKSKVPCQDVPIVIQNIMAALKGQETIKNISILQEVYYKRIHAVFEKVVKLMIHGQKRFAFELVGKQNLEFLREASLIGVAVHKRLKMQKPRPPSTPAPGGKDYDAPFPATFLRDLKNANDPRGMK